VDNASLINKIKANAITLVALITAIIVSFTAYQAKEKEIQIVRSQKAVEEQKNAVLEEIGLFEKKLEKLKKGVNSKEPEIAMDKIGDLAKVSLVQVAKIIPLKEAVLGVYTKYPYELALSAKDYHQIGKFISALENSPDMYMVESLVINNNDASETDHISASLTVYTIMINP
jgi:Tfp pilus assembly protein PilO